MRRIRLAVGRERQRMSERKKEEALLLVLQQQQQQQLEKEFTYVSFYLGNGKENERASQ